MPKANVSLTNDAELNVRGSDAGSIAINAQNLSLAGASKVRAGIDTGLGTPESKAGNIDINATGATNLTDDSFIANVPQPTSVGQGGNINITTGSLVLINGSYLNSNNFGQGDGGNINLNIRDALTLSGVGQTGSSAILSSVRSPAVGKGGNINITAGSVSLADSSQLSASTYGQGDAGNVSIQARDFVSLAGNNTTIFSNIESGGVGNGGNINIIAPSLSLQNGAQLQAGLRGTDIQDNLPGGRGNGGNINIKSGSLSLGEGTFINASTAGNGNAGNIFVQARDAVSLKDSSSIFSTVNAGAVGNGGNITIDAASVSLTNGSEFNSRTLGQGNGGNVQVTARALSLTNGSQLTASGFGQGDAGNISVDVGDIVSLDGVGSNGLSSSVRTSAIKGNGGDIQLTTGSFSVTNGAQLLSTTSGQGNGGDITINARDRVKFDGVGSNQRFSGAFSNVESGGVGNAGDIKVTTGSLSLSNSAKIAAATFGTGNAGDININARDAIALNGINNNQFSTGVFSTVESSGVGKGGDIQLTSGSLSLANQAQINSSISGQGNAGNIFVQASDLVSLSDSSA